MNIDNYTLPFLIEGDKLEHVCLDVARKMGYSASVKNDGILLREFWILPAMEIKGIVKDKPNNSLCFKKRMASIEEVVQYAEMLEIALFSMDSYANRRSS